MKFIAPISVLLAVLAPNGVRSDEEVDAFVGVGHKGNHHAGLRTNDVSTDCDTTLESGALKLGLNAEGTLIDGCVGLTYNGHESLRRGGYTEGFGASAVVDGTSFWGGKGNARSFGNNLETPSPITFTGTDTAETKVQISTGPLEVTHQFKPSPESSDLFEITVIYKNTSTTQTLEDLRYRRVMDWDVRPYKDCVSLFTDGANPKYLEYSTNLGFTGVDPSNTPLDGNEDYYYYFKNSKTLVKCPGSSECNDEGAFNIGPYDQGAMINFHFDDVTIPPMGTFSFKIYYGASANQAAAATAVDAVGATAGSYAFAPADFVSYYNSGSCTDDSAGSDTGVFIFGFKPFCELPPGGCVANGDQYCCENGVVDKYNVCILDSDLNLVSEIRDMGAGTKCCAFPGSSTRILPQFLDAECP